MDLGPSTRGRASPWLAWAAVAALGLVPALAGCAADAPAPASTTPAAAARGLPVPAWALRDYWVYEVGGQKVTYVVTEDLGPAWRVDTDSESRAFQDALEDISRLGPQRKADLAGSQHEDAVEFFHWPLTAGATWTTRWDGAPATVKVLTVDAGGATLEARDPAGALVYAYRYDAQAHWFGRLVHFGPDGKELVRLELAESGHAWHGNVVRWTLAPGPAHVGPPPLQDVIEFDVADGTTDLWVRYHFDCSPSGAYKLDVAPQSGPGGHAAGVCQNATFAGTFVDAPVPGAWGLTALVPGAAGTADYTILLRTRTTLAVG